LTRNELDLLLTVLHNKTTAFLLTSQRLWSRLNGKTVV